MKRNFNCIWGVVALGLWRCAAPEPEGLRLADEGIGPQIKFDLFHKPLPEIPFPNDIATRFDPLAPTKRRVNASLEADTQWEKWTRYELNQLDGFGTFAPITVSFDEPLDVEVIYSRHQGDDFNFNNDAVLVLDVNPNSEEFCRAVPLDMGEGNFPLTLEEKLLYPNDPRENTEQALFEEVEEDLNGNGELDLGEDTDMDGVLDHPNFRNSSSSRFSAMTFYERETNTLIMRPVMPMREQNSYAVVLTKRLLGSNGEPIRSPHRWVNHTSQTKQLKPLPECLAHYGLSLEDVAYTWAFTTQSIHAPFIAIRDGLNGLGPLSRLADQYPAEISKWHDLRNGTDVNVKIVPGEEFLTGAQFILGALYPNSTPQIQQILESHKNVDFHVVLSIASPQFFPRKDEDGKDLPLYRQTWKLDPVTGEAFVRSETLTVWITVPKNRKGQPAPLSILGHGYTGNKLDPILYGGYFAQMGLASLGAEAVSHGLPFGEIDRELAVGAMKSRGLEKMASAMLQDRAFDQNRDKINDSAADFWTSYMAHTRDVVRQSVVDYMRIIQVLKSFDGKRTWKYDVNRDGKPDLAGDFDGDGTVDVAGESDVSMTGGSLGGITSTMIGGLEPKVSAVVPVAGGGGLTNIGMRSVQFGVVEAVTLRSMGPLLLTLPNANQKLDLWQYLPDLNTVGKVKIGELQMQPKEGDTAVLFNLKTGDYRCARFQKEGLLRVSVPSDAGDALRLEFFSGPLPSQERQGCRVPENASRTYSIDAWSAQVKFQGITYEAGAPLIALGDGFGLRRGTPEYRRILGVGQILLDSADPINFAPNFERRTLRYGTGETVETRAIVINTVGDMNVPVSTGISIARAAGFVELYAPDARYGKTVNRMLIDTGSIEGVERVGRYFNSKNEPVLMDLEHLSLETGKDDLFDVPRLSPPLRAVTRSKKVNGFSGMLMPMVLPQGRHGFDPPNPQDPFNLGSYMVNLLGRYLSTGGQEFEFSACLENSTCSWISQPPPPPPP